MSPIVVAPFSNSGIRNWPGSHYRSMISLLLDRLAADRPIWVTGAPSQKLRANEIVRAFPLRRVVNVCGRLSWSELVEEVAGAGCLIANNSGLAHIGGRLGVPTVCVFGGSHQRHEWRPLGSTVILVTRSIGCSPCQLDHGQVSPYDKACLREIEPRVVADAVFTIMNRVAATRDAIEGVGQMRIAGNA